MPLVTLTMLLLWSITANSQSLQPVQVFDQCPARGTVVSEAPYCGAGLGRWNKYEKIANGQCGTYRRVVERNSVECGYTPGEPVCPIKGTDLEIRYCGDPNGTYFTKGDPSTQYTRIANGTCGSWRRTIEVDSESCAPKISIEAIETTGDRFRPVMFEVSFDRGGESLEWTYEITDSTIGNVTKTPDALMITSDGRLGDGVITIEGEEYVYTIQEEPRCATPIDPESDYSRIDCQGYTVGGSGQKGTEAGFIYYGEEDERIVTWEWGWLWATNDDYYELLDPSDERYAQAELHVEKMNEILEQSGVFARIKLVGVATGKASLQVNMSGLYELGMPRFDALAQEGTTYPNTCGVAYGTGTINKSPRTWLSACGWYTALHEFGHSVGLNHGPFNSANAGTGWVFYDFGHGSYTNCTNKDDLMSYSGYGVYFANSDINCDEMFDSPPQPSVPSGIRQGTSEEDIGDTAYALNRIRYDIAMIHDENESIQFDTIEDDQTQEEPPSELIIDEIDDFDDGRERYERALRVRRNMGMRETNTTTIER